MTLLITGSSGHLGEALVRTLKAMNHKVIGIDIIPSNFTDKVGSIADREFVRQCMKGVDAILHTATLHKPHVITHSYQDFVDTNITGTLNLLEEGLAAGISSFIFTSTTSTFGDALTPPAGAPTAWVTEDAVPIPKNIYGVTKTAAEDLCKLFHRNHKLPCLILKTSRFFPEEDDQKKIRQTYEDANVKANEFLFRRVDVEDVVNAHLLAFEKASVIGFGRYIISATSPFTTADLLELHTNAPLVVKRLFPDYEEEYARRGWKMFPTIGRVYVNERARKELGWTTKYEFRYVLDKLKANADPRSSLAIAIGSKGYHELNFSEGPYPVK
ncbi:MAG TPA: NAD(P)-dependent oxidoreductase [Chitinophagaceae bacterium]|nr:NAD(P)-dependent oxidoreductase [Chitinophagaceae bacterium]